MNPKDICFCGDYRHQHNMDGACRVCKIHAARLKAPCKEFRHDKIRQDMEAIDGIIDETELTNDRPN